MSEIINGKEALIALANGEEVQVWNGNIWWDVEGNYQINVFLKTQRKFRFKPHPILINGIEVPAPFEPNEFEDCYMLSDLYAHGYTKTSWKYSKSVPAWRTEDGIKKVVSALRSIFKGDVK